jgi:hypothetical protein
MKNLLIILFIFLFQPGSAQTNIGDSLALVDLYNATDGPNWSNNTNWLTGPVKTWYGIIKHQLPFDTNRVEQVSLSNNNLTGYIPSSIGNLTWLGNLTLYNNNLSGTIPEAIGRCIRLTGLYLWNNQMSGYLTDSICKCIALNALYLNNNHFTGKIPVQLNQLTNLGILIISDNQFDGLPDFSAIPNAWVASYDVKDNLLTFNDIEPNMTLGTFSCPLCGSQYYAPQFDSVNKKIDTTVVIHFTLSLHCTMGGLHNIYQWSKNGVDISGAIDSVLLINPAEYADSGIYSCRITNSVVPGLTYYRRPIMVHVDETIGEEEWSPENVGVYVYQNLSMNTLKIAGLPGKATAFVYNINGSLLLSQPLQYSAVDISSFAKGLYFIKLNTAEGSVVRKFVKE